MGHFSEHGGAGPYQRTESQVDMRNGYGDPKAQQKKLNQINNERERKGLPLLSYTCSAHGMPPSETEIG